MSMKRIFAVVLTLALCLTLLPAGALAANEAGNVGPTTIYDNADAAGDDWTWEYSTKTLTLNNAAIRGEDNDGGDSNAIRLPPNSTLSLTGSSTVLAGTAVGMSCGIYCGIDVNGTLSIVGDGSLTVAGGEGNYSCGIYVCRKLNFDDDFTGSVNTVGGKATTFSYGIGCSELSISGTGSVTAVGGEASEGDSCGLCAINGNVAVSGSAVVTAVGGKAENGYSTGICADSVSFSAGNITAVGGSAKESCGIDVYTVGTQGSNSAIISGSAVVNAVGGYAGNRGSYGITGGTVTISDTANVTATGGYAPHGGSCGIVSYKTGGDSLTISGGTVTATGGYGNYGNGAGIWSWGNAEISGGTVTAVGGNTSGESVEMYLDGRCSNDYSAQASLTISGGTVTAVGV